MPDREELLVKFLTSVLNAFLVYEDEELLRLQQCLRAVSDKFENDVQGQISAMVETIIVWHEER